MEHLLFLPDWEYPCLFLWEAEPWPVSGDEPLGATRGAKAPRPAKDLTARLAASGKPGAADVVVPSSNGPCVAAQTKGSTIHLLDAIPILSSVPLNAIESLPASLGAWSLASKLALELVARGRLVPVLGHDNGPSKDRMVARFRVSLASPRDADRACALARAMPAAAHAVPIAGGRTETPPQVWAPGALLRRFLDAAADTIVREAVSLHLDRQGAGQLTQPLPSPRAIPSDCAPSAAARSPSPPSSPARSTAPPWELRFVFGLVSEDAGFDLATPDERALATKIQAWARPVLNPVAGKPRVHRCLSLPDVPSVALTQGAPDRLHLRMKIGSGDAFAAPGAASGACAADRASGACAVDLHGALRFRWEVMLGDHVLSPRELDAISSPGAPLVPWRGRWVAAGGDEIEAFKAFLSVAPGGGILPARTGLRAALTGSIRWPGLPHPIEVVADTSLAAVLSALRSAPDSGSNAALPPGLAAPLAPYQERTFTWLARLAALGFGGCVADGAELDAKAPFAALFLALTTRPEGRPILVVCPAPTVADWERELARLAPSLTVARHISAVRAQVAVVITSYEALLRDEQAELDSLASIEWLAILLDDAGRVRDPSSRVLSALRSARARAPGLGAACGPVVRKARAPHVFAIAPIDLEQIAIAELWSLLDFTNPGLFGPLEAFARDLALPASRFGDPEATTRLFALVRPFLLRRTRRDLASRRDLPPPSAAIEPVEDGSFREHPAEPPQKSGTAQWSARGVARGSWFEIVEEVG